MDVPLTKDVEVLDKLNEDNLIAAYAIYDIMAETCDSFLLISTTVEPLRKHKIATFVNVADPDWEEEIDVSILENELGKKLEPKVGGLFQFISKEEEKIVSINETYYNKTAQQRFGNIADYITFYIELLNHSRNNSDDATINYALIEGAYALCNFCDETNFKHSPLCENGLTETKNKVTKKVSEIKKVMFRKKQDEKSFLDLSTKTLDCLEEVSTYFFDKTDQFEQSKQIINKKSKPQKKSMIA